MGIWIPGSEEAAAVAARLRGLRIHDKMIWLGFPVCLEAAGREEHERRCVG